MCVQVLDAHDEPIPNALFQLLARMNDENDSDIQSILSSSINIDDIRIQVKIGNYNDKCICQHNECTLCNVCSSFW